MEKAPQAGDSGPTLHLCDTAELLGEEINTTDAVQKYEAVLTDVLRAFLASDPDQPMMQLLAEASAPQWFPE
jgi:hypothetical protein